MSKLPERVWTLLIDQEHLSPSTRRLLAASNNRNAYIPRKGTLANIFCAKAIYRGDRPGDGLFGDATLEINVAAARGRLPILDDEIATELQRRLLAGS